MDSRPSPDSQRSRSCKNPYLKKSSSKRRGNQCTGTAAVPALINSRRLLKKVYEEFPLLRPYYSCGSKFRSTMIKLSFKDSFINSGRDQRRKEAQDTEHAWHCPTCGKYLVPSMFKRATTPISKQTRCLECALKRDGPDGDGDDDDEAESATNHSTRDTR